eukprot:579001_1
MDTPDSACSMWFDRNSFFFNSYRLCIGCEKPALYHCVSTIQTLASTVKEDTINTKIFYRSRLDLYFVPSQYKWQIIRIVIVMCGRRCVSQYHCTEQNKIGFVWWGSNDLLCNYINGGIQTINGNINVKQLKLLYN